MSLLQNAEFTIYQLRTSYLSNVKDGVGERLISVSPAVFNTPGFRSAGWQLNPADVKRTYSPPIPTAVASEYFQGPPRSAGLPPAANDDEDEGGMITGVGGSGDTLGPGAALRRRKRKEQVEEDDSSDLSDESDDEAEASQRAAQQIKFAKMPVRTRSGSSPIRSSTLKDGPSVMITSPSRRSGDSRLRRGSLGAVEAVKARARRDTTTSSEMSSENELDPSLFRRKEIRRPSVSREPLPPIPPLKDRTNTKESTDLEDEGDDMDDDSDGTTLSSEFTETAESASLLDGVPVPMNTPPFSENKRQSSPHTSSPKRPRQPQAVLQALPPPRPISTVQPISALTQAMKVKRSKDAMPFESFATLSGKGDPNPLHLKIYAPFAKTSLSSFEVPVRRTTRDDNGLDRKVTVADCIGLSLWRYAEEGLAPAVTGEKMNVNRWIFRMVEDGEVDFDFLALERTKAINDFTSNNNRAARARSSSKTFDEFALVEASESEFKVNERLTPSFSQEASARSDTPEEPTQQTQPAASLLPNPEIAPSQRRNPVLGPSFVPLSTLRKNSTTPADTPMTPASHATPRTGASKILRVHYTSPQGYPQLVAVDVTTDTYLAEVLTTVCRKRRLDKAHHILKLSKMNVVVPLDRTVESLGDRADLDLVQRRFGNDGPLGVTGSPGSTPPNAPLLVGEPRRRKVGGGGGGALGGFNSTPTIAATLAGDAGSVSKQDMFGMSMGMSGGSYKKYTVWRKQPMGFMPTHERTLGIDGEYLHIMPGETGKSTLFDSSSKTTTIHFSNIIGCKSSRKHPSNFRVVVFRERESKRYDFETSSPVEAAGIVADIKRGVDQFRTDR